MRETEQTRAIEAKLKEALAKMDQDNDDVLTVVILHRTIIELTILMSQIDPADAPPPFLDALLTICARRVSEFYKQRNIQMVGDFDESTTLQ